MDRDAMQTRFLARIEDALLLLHAENFFYSWRSMQGDLYHSPELHERNPH